MKSLLELAAEVHANNLEKGWYESHRTFGDYIALLHSEASEMLEAFRDWGVNDATIHNINDETLGRLPKPEGVGAEAADVFIRLLDTCHHYGIDLQAEYDRKMAYNKTRPYRHGGKNL